MRLHRTQDLGSRVRVCMKANHRLQVGPGSRVEDSRFYILYEKVMPMHIFRVPGFGCKV